MNRNTYVRLRDKALQKIYKVIGIVIRHLIPLCKSSCDQHHYAGSKRRPIPAWVQIAIDRADS
jgi:hypothetical protein